MLEGGAILVQYKGLSDRQRSQLDKLADGQVTVAPNPDLPAPVVATAWTAKLVCTDVDRGALQGFVRDFAGKGAGHP
jgi:hypothetical protein